MAALTGGFAVEVRRPKDQALLRSGHGQGYARVPLPPCLVWPVPPSLASDIDVRGGWS
jgi:hypothetical protein